MAGYVYIDAWIWFALLSLSASKYPVELGLFIIHICLTTQAHSALQLCKFFCWKTRLCLCVLCMSSASMSCACSLFGIACMLTTFFELVHTQCTSILITLFSLSAHDYVHYAHTPWFQLLCFLWVHLTMYILCNFANLSVANYETVANLFIYSA